VPGRDYRSRLYETYFSSSGYERLNPTDDAGYRSHGRVLRQILLPHLPSARKAAVLDVACGSGFSVEMLLQEGYSDVRGLDLSPEQVERAVARGLPVERGDVFNYLADVRDEYDAMIAFDFIEHLDRNELFRFLEAARAALRPGGRLIVKTPNASCLFGTRSRYVDLTHELVFTEKSIRAAFTVCGLQPVIVTGERIRPSTVKGWMRWVPAKAVRTLWKAYLIVELAEEAFSIPTEFNLIAVAEKAPAQ
jgi:2-polyprenyl-3-methyl-5-hydroxy-6-metoxy-1,4-benzoquinol methylase